MSATAAATDAPEMVLVPYDDFFAAYRFVPRSRMFPNDCLKTRLRSLLASEDVAHADEAEAIADRQAREEARDGGGWRVKPLEWTEVDGGDWLAICDLGLYRCGNERGVWRVEFARADKRLPSRKVIRLTGLISAQAAAQANYEARIRSAIEPSPVEGDRR